MENQTQNLCRVCFEVGHFHLNGYEINIQGKNISIDEMIKRFSDMEFTAENAPELICENCTHDLVQSYLFFEKILEADAKILSLAQVHEEEKQFYEPELLELKSENHDEEDASQTIEGHEVMRQDVEGQNEEVLNSNEVTVYEEDQCDLIEEIAESNIVEEMYIESEISSDEIEEKIPTAEPNALPALEADPPDVEYNAAPINYNFLEFEGEVEGEESTEPRRKYQRRNKEENEIDKNGSFIVTKFACSTSAPGMQRNTNTEDNDEVTLSDVRIMNYETVEVKAGNIDVLNQDGQNELPIDESRVYLCQYCPRAFSSSSFLVAHVRKTHGCKFCSSLFEKAKDLYAHIREAHSKFECVVCCKEFASNSNMRNHLKTVHKLKVPPNVSLISYKRQSEMEETV
ncbi:zinc finger protein 652 [Eupeodes corollae]|uniref:zinc finger protein 652 n=1 Tax=Eupeodes corollae TaxID=290404 RepID=UPI00249283FB|nr:zinc finger protein 652 [Eupeodes corollae]